MHLYFSHLKKLIKDPLFIFWWNSALIFLFWWKIIQNACSHFHDLFWKKMFYFTHVCFGKYFYLLHFKEVTRIKFSSKLEMEISYHTRIIKRLWKHQKNFFRIRKDWSIFHFSFVLDYLKNPWAILDFWDDLQIWKTFSLHIFFLIHHKLIT